MIFTDISQGVFSVGRITPNGVSLLGTAFAINKPGYFATAAHVVNHNDSGLVIVFNELSSVQDYQDTSTKQIRYTEAKIAEVNPICDVCLLKTAMPIQSTMLLSSTDRVQVGGEVVAFGYPHSDHGRMVLTQQNTHIGAKVLIESSGLKVENVVLNIQTRPGQSGGPIICPATREIVGMIIGSYAPSAIGGVIIGGIDPQTLHQTTHAISAEYIKEML